MFKAPRNFLVIPFEFYFQKWGSENAFTSYDYTAYFQTIASDKIDKILEMEADRMRNLVLTKSQIETERKVILEKGIKELTQTFFYTRSRHEEKPFPQSYLWYSYNRLESRNIESEL